RTTLYPIAHEKLVAYQVACELLITIVRAGIRDSNLRDQALRAAKSACLNIAEANGRASPADRRRVFAIARGESAEAIAAMHVAGLSGACSMELADQSREIGSRLLAPLGGLLR